MDSLLNDFVKTRRKSLKLCEPLETEDYVVQPWSDVSPPKWHLGHTTWFFEKFILANKNGYRAFRENYDLLFNSYYKTLGDHWKREKRGVLSRPTVREVVEYRKHVDRRIVDYFAGKCPDARDRELLEVGIHHEMQHQELLLMDIKAILSQGLEEAPYVGAPPAWSFCVDREAAREWIPVPGKLARFGAQDEGFSYDNEKPRHEKRLEPAFVSSRFVTNGDFVEFIEDGGYRRPELWLSLGWDWLNENQIEAPLYWRREGQTVREKTLYGTMELKKNWPVQHISFFEADAFASWKGLRLPSEAELEFVCCEAGERKGGKHYHGVDAQAIVGELWCWTSDQYRGYPGYRSYSGSLGEYNQKFMCNQFVLRGGCYGTPQGHFRPTYRNFYEPWQRWMFSGIRLAKNAS